MPGTSKQALKVTLCLLLTAACTAGCADQFFYHNLVESAGKEVDEGDYAEAERLYKKAVETAEKLGAKDSRLVKVLELLARFYLDLGRYSEAKATYEKALKIRESEHPKVSFEEKFLNHRPFVDTDSDEELAGRLNVINQISICDFLLHDYKKSLEHADSVMKQAEESAKDSKSSSSTSYQNLQYSANRVRASCYRELGNFKEAVEIYHKMLSEDGKYFSDSKLKTMLNLAMTYELQGDYKQAGNMYNRCQLQQEIQKKGTGDVCSDVLKNRIQISGMTDGGTAPLVERAVKSITAPNVSCIITEKVVLTRETSFPLVQELARIYLWRGKLQEAETLFKHAVEMQENELKKQKANADAFDYDTYHERLGLYELQLELAKIYRLTAREKDALALEKIVRDAKAVDEKKQKRYRGSFDD